MALTHYKAHAENLQCTLRVRYFLGKGWGILESKNAYPDMGFAF
jgi:hypothetical protein